MTVACLVAPTLGAAPGHAAEPVGRPALAGAPAACAPAAGLACVARRAGVRWGAAVEPPDLDDARTRDALRTQFTMFTPENDLKFGPTRPTPDRSSFAAADRLIAFARQHQMRVRGAVMFWYVQNPGWLAAAVHDRPSGLREMRAHIRLLFEHFVADRDVIDEWDVVNEAFEPDGTLRDTVWRRAIGDDYIEQAYRIAGEELARVNARIPGLRHDWQLELFYNDFVDDTFVGFDTAIDASGQPDPSGVAHPGLGVPAGSGDCAAAPKCAAIQRLARRLVRDGVPLDGIGLQAHIASVAAPDYDRMTDWIGPLGLRWAVTELDNPCGPHALPALNDGCSATTQAQVFGSIAAACLSDPACDTIVQWGISDADSWWDQLGPAGLFQDPLAFDRQLRPKPAAERLRALFTRAAAMPPAHPPLRLTARRLRGGRLRLGVRGATSGATASFSIGERVVQARPGPTSLTVRLTRRERRARRLELTAVVRRPARSAEVLERRFG